MVQRAFLARAWRISPAELRSCTGQEVEAMWTVLKIESERNRRG